MSADGKALNYFDLNDFGVDLTAATIAGARSNAYSKTREVKANPMSDSLYLTSMSLFLGTVLAVFAMIAFASVQRARARLANDGAYRQVAEAAARAAAETASSLAVIRAALADTSARLGNIEKVLKDV